ncbi:aminotransferase class I/II-fold pyridoxal phosphate-dependent enzyme [Thermocatellispora tengchongensis]|uniref:aminotransferase class I/II-fold pyridoxal phosphate-dependent enzyme n=1 Tax=Thermocatellispora tengchongensis TaxID=1073253 RepID=UPI0036405766
MEPTSTRSPGAGRPAPEPGGYDPLARFRAAAAARETAGLRRALRHRAPDHGGLIDLASNDYLGLARDPRPARAAAEATLRWGTGSTGSRLVTGSTSLHAELEDALCAFTQAPAPWCSPRAIWPTWRRWRRWAAARWWSRRRATTPRSSTAAAWPGRGWW